MRRIFLSFAASLLGGTLLAQVVPIQAPAEMLDAPFGLQDEQNF